MKIYIGYDHGGYDLAQEVKTFLAESFSEYEVEDVGCRSAESCDHAEFGSAVAKKIAETPDSRGIVICGSGVGISIAANRIRGARCVLANSVELATLSRQHNDANVIAMGGRTKFYDSWKDILTVFLTTEADTSERHVRRRAQLDEL